MKKIIVVLLLFSVQFGFGQDISLLTKEKQVDITEKNISKKWVFHDLINNKKTPAQIEQTKQTILNGNEFNFKADKTFTGVYIMETVGKWNLDKKNKLLITDTNIDHIVWHILGLSNKELIIASHSKPEMIFIYHTE